MTRTEKLEKARFYYNTSKFYSIGKCSKTYYKQYKKMIASIEPKITDVELNKIPTKQNF